MNDATLKVPGRITDRTVHRLVVPRPDDLSGGATFKVTRWPVEPGADVEKLAEETVREAARRFPRYRFLGSSRREIDGLPALDVRFTREGKDDEVYVRQAHVVVRETWLVFAASGGLGRVGAPRHLGAPLTEPDLWASHPALRDAGVQGYPRIPAPAFPPAAIPVPA